MNDYAPTTMQTTNAPKAIPRLDSIDILRGLVMVVMALDHVRDFFSNAGIDPTDLTKTNAALFLTRWITHYCAPTFVFLAGTGAFLAGQRGRSKAELSRFLWTRGLWLVFLELTWVRFGWTFNFDVAQFNAGAVIWAIGWSMVVLSALVYLPLSAVTLFGVAMIALHNTLDGVPPENFGKLGWLWSILHAGGMITMPGGGKFAAAYPLIPWIGVMAAGYGFGSIYLWETDKRRSWLVKMGAGLVVAFVVIRATNLYGDASPWKSQKNGLFTVFSFLNCTKYPPSLLYLLMTLGPAMLLLAVFEKKSGWITRRLVTFGRVPFFYYMLHLPLIHGAAYATALLRGDTASAKYLSRSSPFDSQPPGFGYDLWVVYLVWVLLILALYPICHWFAEVKRRRKDVWLSYL